MKPFRISHLALAAVVAAGCGTTEPVPAIDSQQIALAAKTNFHEVAGRLAAAARFLGDSDVLERFLPFDECGAPTRGGPPSIDGGQDEEDDCRAFDFTRSADDFADWLESRVFVQANVESARGGVVVFRLRSDVTCDRNDKDCRKLLDRVAVRLRVTSPADGDLGIDVLIEQNQPLTIKLHRQELAVEVNLAAVKASLDALDRSEAPMPVAPGGRRFALHSDDDDGDLVDSMVGRIELAIVALADNRFEARVSVLEAIDVRSSGPNGVSISLAQAIPAFTAILDGDAQNVSLRANLGRVDLAGPASAFDPRGRTGACWSDEEGNIECEEEPMDELSGRIAIHLGGLDGTTHFQAGPGADSLQLLGFGLGNTTTSVTLDGAPLFSLDLNPNHGRHLDLTAARDDDGYTTLQVTPALELSIGVQLVNLAGQIEVAPWALNELFTVRLDGAPAPKIRFRDGYEFGSGGGGMGPGDDDWEHSEGSVPASLEVLAGTLTLESRSQPAISVSAGMCLLGIDDGADTPEPGGVDGNDPSEDGQRHPFEGLSAGACQ